jgi:hypothetical protein
MNRHRISIAALIALLTPAVTADAQQFEVRKKEPGVVVAAAKPFFQVIEAAPLESISLVKDAPFYADAITEFTQILGDGNRIDRRYVSSIARDSRGRTRREEEIALVGLGAAGPSPRLVTIVDPDARLSYTLDETLRVAHRNAIAPAKLIELAKVVDAARALDAARVTTGGGGRGAIVLGNAGAVETRKAATREGDAASTVKMESLGTRSIEGVSADGTRTTSIVPAGAIGNLLPIEVVTERWFSAELQMPVLITRRDPRAGETVYRLTGIVRAEPAEALFVVPPDYEVRDGSLTKVLKMREAVNISPKKK